MRHKEKWKGLQEKEEKTQYHGPKPGAERGFTIPGCAY